MTASLPLAAWRVERWAVGRLWSSPYDNPWRAITSQIRNHDRAVLLVRVFYACGVFLTIHSMPDWPALLEVEGLLSPWPSTWIPRDSVQAAVPWLLGGHLAASLVVAAVPWWRPARIAYFLGLMQYVSLISGFGGVSHNNHVWLWLSGIFILLPNRRWAGRTSVADRRYFLGVFWLGQLMVLLFYALTGFWKIVFGLHGVITERASSFGIDGFSLMVAEQQLRANQDPLLGQFFVDSHVIGWAMFSGTVYIEAAALAVAFRPRLHRAWGILLIAVHIGIELAMGFTFLPNVLALGIVAVCSPLAPDHTRVSAAVLDLPGVYVARRWSSRFARQHPRARPGAAAPEQGCVPADVGSSAR